MGLGARKRLLTRFVRSMLGDFACLGDFGNDVEAVAGAWGLVQTGDVYRHGGRGGFVSFGGLKRVVHCLDAAKSRATDDDVADLQGSLFDQELGDHSATFVQFGFQAGAHGRAVGVGFVLVQLGHGQQRIYQLVDAFTGDGAGFDHFGIAAPFTG